MIQEPFAVGHSFVHRLDPRIRISTATVYSLVVAVSMTFQTLITAFIISLILLGLTQINIKKVMKRLAVVNGLILLFWLLLPLTFEGEALFHVGPLTVTRPGVLLSARITIKSNAILLTFISLVATMSIATLGHAMDRLGIPSKIVHLLLLTYRYIFVIEQEYQRLTRSAKIRGFRPRTNMHTYRTVAYFIGMLFVRASNRAERVHQAMLCRGFNGKFFCLSDFVFSSKDWFFSVFMGVLIVGLGMLEWKIINLF